MLFLLRQLRRLELRKRSGRYFLYAFGEIFLIVLGIMIALEANEWKEERRDRAEEREYIQRLIVELEKDVADLERNAINAERRLGFVKLLMDVSVDVQAARDRSTEFVVGLMHAGYLQNSTITTDTFDELGSTGNLRLLDTDLRSRLLNFHRNHGNARQFDRHNDLVSTRYFELSSGILSLEQARWVLDQGIISKGIETGIPSLELKPMNLNPAWVDEIHDRFSADQELISWLPILQRTRERILNGHNNLEERAKELLKALKAAQEELEN